MSGFFITFEGIDAVGKTTQIELLKQNFSKQNLLFTKNPGGTNLGIKLRELLLHNTDYNLNNITELLLYTADRAEHIAEIIQPALKENKTIICDRFTDSTIAYQGFGHNLNLQKIINLNEIACNGINPDLTILFDLPAEISLNRLKTKDKIENRGLEFLNRVRNGFLTLAEQNSKRIKIINTENKSIESINKEILDLLNFL